MEKNKPKKPPKADQAEEKPSKSAAVKGAVFLVAAAATIVSLGIVFWDRIFPPAPAQATKVFASPAAGVSSLSAAYQDSDSRIKKYILSAPGNHNAQTFEPVFAGDFDVQIDYKIQDGWTQPAAGSIIFAFEAYNKEKGWHYDIRRSFANKSVPADGRGLYDAILEYRIIPGMDNEAANKGDLFKDAEGKLEGKFRLTRKNNVIVSFYDIGSGFQILGTYICPDSPAQICVECIDDGKANQPFQVDFYNDPGLSGLRG